MFYDDLLRKYIYKLEYISSNIYTQNTFEELPSQYY